MADENTNNNSGDTTVTTTSGDLEITFDSLAEVEVADLNDNQKQFILDNAGDLSDEQRETYKDVLEGSGDDEDVNPDDVEIETRGGKKENEEEEDSGDEDDDEVDPDDKKAVGKVVEEKLTDFRKTQTEVQQIKDKQEVNDFVSDNPEFKKYRDVMLKYMAHPAYKNLPVKNISLIVAGSDLQKLGAKKEREAAAKAKETQDGGTTVRPSGGGSETDWGKASKEAFEKKKNEVMGIPNQ